MDVFILAKVIEMDKKEKNCPQILDTYSIRGYPLNFLIFYENYYIIYV